MNAIAMLVKTPPKDEPWYHVLIDEEGHVAYVAQRNLEPDNLKAPVEHPLLNNFLKALKRVSIKLAIPLINLTLSFRINAA